MESDSFQQALKAQSGGAAIQNVASVKILKDIKIPLPSVGEQDGVIAKWDAFKLHIEDLKDLYERKLSALSQLKQSILKKVFDGELSSRSSSILDAAAE